MSEYSNRQDRGRLVGMVFSMQALGLIVGPLVALVLLSSGVSQALSWRLLLGLGAIPAASVIYLRAKMPESPRFQRVYGVRANAPAREAAAFSEGVLDTTGVSAEGRTAHGPPRVRDQSADAAPPAGHRRNLVLVRLCLLREHFVVAGHFERCRCPRDARGETGLDTWDLCCVRCPGLRACGLAYGQDRTQTAAAVGFTVMAAASWPSAPFRRLTATVIPFLLVFGLSYFFVEFGPNTTTFVLPSEVFPVSMRTTGHGIAAGVGNSVPS